MGTFISVLSISIGALSLYLIASFFFKNILNNLLKNNQSMKANIYTCDLKLKR
jgi:uncharacterized membrane protein YdjX (TVP38/TMEM64 family)